MSKLKKGSRPSRTPTWAEVTRAKRSSSARMMVQFVWALHNATKLDDEGLQNVISYMHEQQEYFNNGSMNYHDVIKALWEEREIDLRGVEKLL